MERLRRLRRLEVPFGAGCSGQGSERTLWVIAAGHPVETVLLAIVANELLRVLLDLGAPGSWTASPEREWRTVKNDRSLAAD